MSKSDNVDWEQIKVVVFDVDGTLYNQAMMRKKMLFALMKYYLLRPWKLKEFRMLAHFRSEREHRAGEACQDLENAQYNWCAEKHGYAVPHLKEVVSRWMFSYPLRYLAACTYAGTDRFFDALRERNIKIAIYSDYPAHDKLMAMGLAADLIISSTDPAVDRLKPDPSGLHYIMSQLGVKPDECLFIGDRPELDGECARQAGMPYLIVDKEPALASNFYLDLINKLSRTITIKSKLHESRLYSS